ncbi:MAG: hypothetical protein M2R45_05230 [Verrucomicrobia subdivision 3 bacterium]|nr:hypothetical protein [Limisphaerales bacterium]MCS1417463.1 hypothetical protein [Limisphaerales bacterium]
MYIKEAMKLKRCLERQLGKRRYDCYQYVFSPKTGYANAWRVVTVNGLGEELRELAMAYNWEVHGWSLD